MAGPSDDLDPRIAHRRGNGLRVRGLPSHFVVAGDHEPLINYELLGKDATLSAPTPDHYLPLLYVLAQQQEGDEVRFPVEGFDRGSMVS